MPAGAVGGARGSSCRLRCGRWPESNIQWAHTLAGEIGGNIQ